MIAEESLERAVAVTAPAPIAVQLTANERVHWQTEGERRRRLDQAFAAAPPLEQPTEPVPDPLLSLGERVPAMIGWTLRSAAERRGPSGGARVDHGEIRRRRVS